jgi:glutathione synthase/RimK-type ligase-like ATP-grasp enzyme
MKILSASQKMLGMNARNLLYVRRFTPPAILRILDNKLKTKHQLTKRGIPVPHTYAVIRSVGDLARFA